MPNEYPTDGNIEAVKAWVGDDPEKAQEALDREYDRSTGARATLVPQLEAVVSGEAPPAPIGSGPPGAVRTADGPVFDPDKEAADIANRDRWDEHWAEAKARGDEIPERPQEMVENPHGVTTAASQGEVEPAF